MKQLDISALRREYTHEVLSEHSVQRDPLGQFVSWYDEAIGAKVNEPTAMVLATSDIHNRPSARVVLLKGVSDSGFIFYTNYGSRKGNALADNPYAELVFFWPELERQIRISGYVVKISEQESDEYFATRPRESQVGAWASQQSAVVRDREYLEARFASLSSEFAERDISRPDSWGGYILRPLEFEFWQGRMSRLHDRIRYRTVEDSWVIERLNP